MGGMLGWPNGADPPPYHGWCQCQHTDFVCKLHPTNQPDAMSIPVMRVSKHNT